jgi:hypothetical protein
MTPTRPTNPAKLANITNSPKAFNIHRLSFEDANIGEMTFSVLKKDSIPTDMNTKMSNSARNISLRGITFRIRSIATNINRKPTKPNLVIMFHPPGICAIGVDNMFLGTPPGTKIAVGAVREPPLQMRAIFEEESPIALTLMPF